MAKQTRSVSQSPKSQSPATSGSPGRRRRFAPLVTGTTISLVFAIAAGLGLALTTQLQADSVARITEVSAFLTPRAGSFVNYLLVGSDTREGSDPTSPDYGGIGDTAETTGRRSDTIMVMHVDTRDSSISLTSIPRDLWIDIPGYETNRINAAYGYGAAVLVDTVQSSLGIPIHHYIEVNFNSFKSIVAAIDGVELCFEYPTRDINTGLNIVEPGCFTLDEIQSLAYARSRYYEVFRDGEWDVDGRADLGRIERQQAFVQAAASKSVSHTAANPFRAASLIAAAVDSLLADPSTDVIEVAGYLRSMASGGLNRFALPVYGETVDGKSVLLLERNAADLIGFLAGTAPPPFPQG